MRCSPSSDSSPGASQFAQRLQCQVKTAECFSNAGWPDSRVGGLQYCLQIALSPASHPEKPMKSWPGQEKRRRPENWGEFGNAWLLFAQTHGEENNNNNRIKQKKKQKTTPFWSFMSNISPRGQVGSPGADLAQFLFVIWVLFGFAPLSDGAKWCLRSINEPVVQLHCASLMILGGPCVCSKCSQSFWKEWNSLLTHNSHTLCCEISWCANTMADILTCVYPPQRTKS